VKGTPVCIAGMHRSGTSLLARLLHECGLHIGRSDELVPATPANVEGYWEHAAFVEFNERLLAEVGGAWDIAPPLTAWDELDSRETLMKQARELLDDLSTKGVWGWKDPRNSITMPFWTHVLPDMKVVICVRNPLEVALSLRNLNAASYQDALALWVVYSERVLAATQP